jgi:N utilization substance protein B
LEPDVASRRRAREYALQILYVIDIVARPPKDAQNELWSLLMDGDGVDELRPPESEEVEFAQRLVEGVVAAREQLDEHIQTASTNWRLARMPVVDRNILRLASYELSECPDIPANVSVNEAIELAKHFGGSDSRAFVNGIVDRVGRSLGRLDSRRGRARRPD